MDTMMRAANRAHPPMKEASAADDDEENLRFLCDVARCAAEAGAGVVSDALNAGPASVVSFKGATDLVTETDTASESAIVRVIKAMCPEHAILGEEGGVSFGIGSGGGGGGSIADSTDGDHRQRFEYLWAVDPLDGTTNFAHRYPSFGVSVALLRRGRVLASCVVEFTGGPGCWGRRVYVAGAGLGATVNGVPMRVSGNADLGNALLCTGFGYEHGERWEANMKLFKEFTDVTRGVRRLGAASVDLCHVALGVLDCYWEFDCKVWDWAAGALVVAEAGGAVTSFVGVDWAPFENNIVASNGLVHEEVLRRTRPAAEALGAAGVHIGNWHLPQSYPSSFL